MYRSILLFFVFVVLRFNLSFSQTVYNLNAPGSNCYCEMIFEEVASNPVGVIVLDVFDQSIRKYSTDNPYLNSKEFSSYNFLYIKILHKGDRDVMECYQAVTNAVSIVHKIPKSVFFLIQDKTTNETYIQKPGNRVFIDYNVLYNSSHNYQDLAASIHEISIKQSYNLPVGSENNEKLFQKKMSNYSKNFDLGIQLTPLFLNEDKLGISRSAIVPIGLNISKSISSRFAFNGNINVGFKKPDTKSLQSRMQSKIMAAVQNNQDTLYINESLSGHVYIGWDLGLKMFLNKTNVFRPFIMVGIGSARINPMKGEIRDTIDLSGIDMADPSSLQNNIGSGTEFSSGEGALSQVNLRYLMPYSELGFEFRITPTAKFNLSVPLKYYYNKYETGNSAFVTGLNVGLKFTLNPGRFPNK